MIYFGTMHLKRKKHLFVTLLFLTSLSLVPQAAFAIQQNDKLWLAINGQQTLSQDKKWRSYVYTQLRFIKESHPIQVYLLEGALGYYFIEDNSLWLGYRWSGHNPHQPNYYQEDRFFQQYAWKKKMLSFTLATRSRLEQLDRNDQSQITVRFRQRLAIEINHALFLTALPYFYDEVFFQLNHTNYTSNKLVTENRLLIGINFYTSKKTWWEIGYMNQFQMRTPTESANQMSNIITFTYNFS